MPKLKCKADEYLHEDFCKALRHAQAEHDTSRKDLAEQVGTPIRCLIFPESYQSEKVE